MKVIKKDKRIQAFKVSKIERACKRAGAPLAIAQAISGAAAKKFKARKVIKSSEIRKFALSMLGAAGKAKESWLKFRKKKR